MPNTTFPPFYPDVRPLDVEAGGVRFSGVVGGDGPPLLLHGFPQTHVAWRRIAPTLYRVAGCRSAFGVDASVLAAIASRRPGRDWRDRGPAGAPDGHLPPQARPGF